MSGGRRTGRRRSNRWLVVVVWMLVGLMYTTHARTALAADAHVLVLGRISDDPKAHYHQLKPLLDYVVPRMADVGIREGRILMARDVQQMVSYLRRGRVDWVSETSGTGVLLAHRANADILLLTERDGVTAYSTVFLARRDNPIDDIGQLQGRTVAFQSPTSTSAYFVPANEMLQHGLVLESMLSPNDRPLPGAVGYVFARSELNIATWVHKRLVDVGTVSSVDWNTASRVPTAYRRDLKVIHQTSEVPRGLEIVRGTMNKRVRERLQEVLLQAADDPDAREAMLIYFQTNRFVPVDPASHQVLDQLHRGVQRVRLEVE